jgi:hypothetical protein
MEKFRYDGTQCSIRSCSAIRQHFELQVYKQALQEMSNLDTPPPNLYCLSGDEILEVEPQRLKEEESSLEDTKLTLESLLLKPSKNSSNQLKMKAIRQTIGSFSAHLGSILIMTVWLLNQSSEMSFFTNSVLQITAIVSAGVSYQLLYRLQGRIGTVILGGLFLVFTCSLPVVLATGANVVPIVDLQHGCIQLLAILLGICAYSSSTSFEEWSECEELFFALAAGVFASIIMLAFFTDRYLPMALSAGVVGLIGLSLRNCSKDTLIPATTFEQRLLDVVSLYRGSVSTVGYIVKTKIERLIQKQDIF